MNFLTTKRLLLIIVLVFAGIAFSVAQTRVKGTVTDEKGEAVIGAAIMVKGTTVGVTTDFDGNFELVVPESGKILVVSYTGMETQEVAVKPVMNIVLKEKTELLGEVVVTGMREIDKRLNTGATTKINASDAVLGGVADVSRSLEGRAAGVSVQNVSGTFGTAPKIRVRGATSIYGNSKPLWVVDGVVQEDVVEVSADQLSSGDAVTLISSAISGINADDIESFQILKDGSATSIYGARAMAGVIVVTTKRGNKARQSVSYTGEFTMRLKPNYNQFNISNSQEQMGIYKEMYLKGWLELSAVSNNSSSGIYGKMYQLIDTYEKTKGQFGLPNTPPAMNAYLQQAEYLNTDWFDLLFNDPISSISQNHSVSISGGTEKANFYTSISAMNDPGWTASSSVNRYTVNANAAFDIFKDVKLGLRANGSSRIQKAPGTLSQETDVVYGEVKRNFDINPFSYAMNTSRTMDANDTYTRNYAPFNIFHELKNNYIDLKVQDIRFQAELNWKVLRGLEFSGLAAIRYISTTQEHFVKDRSNQAMAYRAGIDPENSLIAEKNKYLYKDPNDPNAVPVTVLPEGGIYFNTTNNMRQLDLRATVNYNRSLGNDEHILSFFGGTESVSLDRNQIYFQGWGFCYDDGGIPFIDPNLFKQQVEENMDYYSNKWQWGRGAAFFAQGTYSYSGKYVASVTGRYEGTNKLGRSRQSRWLPTYNLSGAWNAHEENWFDDFGGKTFTHATLKASYSLTADAGPAFVSNATAIFLPKNPWRPLAELKELGISLDEPANDELTYEKKYEFNIGAELGFLDNRLNVAADVYFRDNFDLIGIVYTQGVGGFVAKYANTANMKSKGVEFTISSVNIDNNNFKWNTDFTFSWIDNKITRLATRSNVISLVSGSGYALEGYPVRALFSIPFEGLNDEGLPTFTNENGEKTVSKINFQEYDPEKLKNLKYEGPTDPTISGGLGNIFTYKGFRLNTFITYSFGNKVRLDPVFSASYSDMDASPKEFKNRWVMPGDEAVTSIPAIASRRQAFNDKQLDYAYNAYNYSTARIADGGFIRLKEVALEYTFPTKLVSSLKLDKFAVKLQATNLLLLYADKKLNGQDPEFMNSGGVATPLSRQFTLTLRLGI